MIIAAVLFDFSIWFEIKNQQKFAQIKQCNTTSVPVSKPTTAINEEELNRETSSSSNKKSLANKQALVVDLNTFGK
jgi:hypothetical protein